MHQKILIAALLVAIASVGYEVYSVRQMSVDVKQQAGEVREMLLEFNMRKQRGRQKDQGHSSGSKTARETPSADSSKARGAVVVLAEINVLGYQNDVAVSDEQAEGIRQKLIDYKDGKIDAAEVQKQVSDLYDPKQADFLTAQKAQVLLKLHDLRRLSVTDDYAYADMAIEMLSKATP